MILSSSQSVGRQSPTMVRARERRRVSHEQLALAVRKHFGSMAIQEGEVVVDFLYKVRWQSKSLPSICASFWLECGLMDWVLWLLMCGM